MKKLKKIKALESITLQDIIDNRREVIKKRRFKRWLLVTARAKPRYC